MKRLVITFFLFFSFFVSAQDLKLDKVSKAELLEKMHPTDSLACAAVLYKKGNSYLTIKGVKWVLVTEVIIRVKIYSQEGYGYAHIAVPFKVYDGIKEGVYFYDAVTYNMSGNRIVKTKLDEENQFVEEIGEDKWIKKITLPDVKDGSVIEYKYLYVSQNVSEFDRWYFAEKIPVNNIEYTVSIPRKQVYNRFFNSGGTVSVKEQLNDRKIELDYSTITSPETQKIYTATNIPALKNDEFANKDSLSYVSYELAELPSPDEALKNFPISWDDVVESIYNNPGFSGQMKKTEYFEEDIQRILAGKELKEDRINAIFSYLKNYITWDEWYGYACRNDIEKAYFAKTGGVAEINLMLVAMLQYAGYNAYPVLLSTRKNTFMGYPTSRAFNYVVAGVEYHDRVVLYDASSKNAQPDILPLWILGGKGRLVKKDYSSYEINLEPKIKSVENTLIMAKIEPTGTVTGQVKTIYHDYNAFVYRENYNILNKAEHIQEEYIGEKEKKLKNIKINSFSVKNLEDSDKPVEENFSFNAVNLCDTVGGKIYVSPMLMYVLEQNPFKEESRDIPVRFSFPYQDKYNINIAVPDGYVVEYVPQPLLLSTVGDISSFKFNMAVNGNQIQILAEIDINSVSVTPEYYETLKEFFANLIVKQTEKIVLVKK